MPDATPAAWAMALAVTDPLNTAVGPGGELVLAGSVGPAPNDFGDGPKTAPVHDAYAASFTPEGKLSWYTQLPPAAKLGQIARAVAVDPSGDIFIAGFVYDPLDPDQFNDRALFAARLGVAGDVVWTKTWVLTANLPRLRVESIALDGAGRVAIAGAMRGTLHFESLELPSPDPIGVDGDYVHPFVVTLSDAGDVEWAASFKLDDDAVATAVAFDGVGTAVLGGTSTEIVQTPNCDPAESNCEYPVRRPYLAAFDASGQVLWKERYEVMTVDGHASVAALAVSDVGEIVITGTTTTPVDFGGGVVATPLSIIDTYVAALSPSGGGLWATSIGGAPIGIEQFGGERRGIVIAPDGRVAVAGTWSLGSPPKVQELFIARLDPAHEVEKLDLYCGVAYPRSLRLDPTKSALLVDGLILGGAELGLGAPLGSDGAKLVARFPF